MRIVRMKYSGKPWLTRVRERAIALLGLIFVVFVVAVAAYMVYKLIEFCQQHFQPPKHPDPPPWSPTNGTPPNITSYTYIPMPQGFVQPGSTAGDTNCNCANYFSFDCKVCVDDNGNPYTYIDSSTNLSFVPITSSVLVSSNDLITQIRDMSFTNLLNQPGYVTNGVTASTNNMPVQMDFGTGILNVALDPDNAYRVYVEKATNFVTVFTNGTYQVVPDGGWSSVMVGSVPFSFIASPGQTLNVTDNDAPSDHAFYRLRLISQKWQQ